jgi:dTDP-4-dehydrorhamnose reductase
MNTILVTGSNGQLGRELQVLSAAYPTYKFLFVTRNELAIDNFEAVEKYFTENNIQYCINCAAYTAVDKAETEKEKAFLINADAAGNLAKICKQYHSGFIHISTDYVFDGTAISPIKEQQPTNPIGIYGASKLKGEELVLEYNPGALIIRTSWVYSSFGNNFVKTMLRLMKERESINVVNDQQGCPTYAADLAKAIMQIINKLLIDNQQLSTENIFNYSNSGNITWYEFAVAIKELTGSKCIVNSIPTAQYPTPAKRPQYSVLNTFKIQQTFNVTVPYWKDSLEKCLSILT